MLGGKIEFDQNFVLDNRNSEPLPVTMVRDALAELYGDSFTVVSEDYALLVFTIGKGAVEQTASRINAVLQKTFSLGDGRQIHEKSDCVYYVYPEVMLALSSSADEVDGSPLSYLDHLVGWDALKALCREIALVAPQIHKHNTQISFQHMNYLFSVNDGAGLTTALNTYADFITALDLFPFAKEDPVAEFKIGIKSEDGFLTPYDAVSSLQKVENRNRLVCFDISALTERTKIGDLKAFLRQLLPLESDYLFAFRIPYIEPKAQKTIYDAIADILYVKLISVPPYTNEQLKQGAQIALRDYDFELDDDAWEIFFSRIAEEKSDGRFYGMQSVRKIVCEILWLKHRADAEYENAKAAENESSSDPVSASAGADATDSASSGEADESGSAASSAEADTADAEASGANATASGANATASAADTAASKEKAPCQADRTHICKNDLLALSETYSETPRSGFDELTELIGMEAITERIREIVSQVRFALKDKSVERPTLHMRFTGAPGTGKTTVARILGKIFAENGILRNGYFFEYMSRDLCGEYVGQTAPKTASICRDAYGSVLFIDEAYALYTGESGNDYGREALTTLVSEMENHRDDMVVIMAGYKDDMNKLMEGNAGLRSRMPYQIDFPSYTKQQLTDIFLLMVRKHFAYEPQLEDAAREFFFSLDQNYMDSPDFSNARFVRNLYERTWSKAATRSQLSGDDNVLIKSEDFRAATAEAEFSEKLHTRHTLGFV